MQVEFKNMAQGDPNKKVREGAKDASRQLQKLIPQWMLALIVIQTQKATKS